MARSRFQRVAKRRVSWEGGFGSSLASGAGSFVTTLVSEAILEARPAPTVVRCRGEFWAKSQTSAINSRVTAGIIVVTAKALAAGVASLPSPLTDVGSDWLWWDTYDLAWQTGEPIESGAVRRLIDSKAMRKVGLNTVVVMVVEVTSISGTPSVDIAFGVRVLLKDS